MGKHEVITTTSTERVRKHRETMHRQGLRLRQVWVRDRQSPEFRKQMQEECREVAEMERANPEEFESMDDLAAHSWDNLPA